MTRIPHDIRDALRREAVQQLDRWFAAADVVHDIRRVTITIDVERRHVFTGADTVKRCIARDEKSARLSAGRRTGT